jgi:hypothetical protein
MAAERISDFWPCYLELPRKAKIAPKKGEN